MVAPLRGGGEAPGPLLAGAQHRRHGSTPGADRHFGSVWPAGAALPGELPRKRAVASPNRPGAPPNDRRGVCMREAGAAAAGYRRRVTASAPEEWAGMVNLDDTRRWPVGPEGERCGRLDELAVVTEDTPAGVLCMTVCDACELIEVVPVLSPAEEAARVREHAQHVGGTWAANSLR